MYKLQRTTKFSPSLALFLSQDSMIRLDRIMSFLSNSVLCQRSGRCSTCRHVNFRAFVFQMFSVFAKNVRDLEGWNRLKALKLPGSWGAQSLLLSCAGRVAYFGITFWWCEVVLDNFGVFNSFRLFSLTLIPCSKDLKCFVFSLIGLHFRIKPVWLWLWHCEDTVAWSTWHMKADGWRLTHYNPSNHAEIDAIDAIGDWKERKRQHCAQTSRQCPKVSSGFLSVPLNQE